MPASAEEQKKLVYVRSAFRNEPDFNIGGISRLASPLDTQKIHRTIDNDVSVSENYQRLIMETIDGVYSADVPDHTTKKELRERIIGKVQAAMIKVFPSLVLEGVGGLFSGTATVGSFYFTKGSSHSFLYKNLSAGEKAAFDLILDAVVKGEVFDDSVWCIDEPETHLNTRIQGRLLEVLLELLPRNSQLVLASHSIGFMRKAWEIEQGHPGTVVFIDMQDLDFDQPQIVLPTRPSREFWSRTLDVALGDLALLMAPEQVVLCEGRPPARNATSDDKAEFDASCYRKIFAAELPGTDFLSVGNSDTVSQDRLGAGQAIQTIVSGTRIYRVVDRDLLSLEEVAEKRSGGVSVLSERNLEAFLLDDEILERLCISMDKVDQLPSLLQIKLDEMQASIAQGHPPDDWKKPASRIYFQIRRELMLTQSGSDWNAFARGTLAPLITPDTQVYARLKRDIFGEA